MALSKILSHYFLLRLHYSFPKPCKIQIDADLRRLPFPFDMDGQCLVVRLILTLKPSLLGLSSPLDRSQKNLNITEIGAWIIPAIRLLLENDVGSYGRN